MAKKVTLKAKEGASPGWPGFFGWLAAVHPRLYDVVRVSMPEAVEAIQTDRTTGSVLGFIEANSPGTTAVPGAAGQTTMDKLLSTITQAGAAYLSLDQQRKILNMQLDRARQGLPPLDVGAYIPPNAGLNVGLNTSTQRTLLLIAAGVGGVFLLSRLARR